MLDELVAVIYRLHRRILLRQQSLTTFDHRLARALSAAQNSVCGFFSFCLQPPRSKNRNQSSRTDNTFRRSSIIHSFGRKSPDNLYSTQDSGNAPPQKHFAAYLASTSILSYHPSTVRTLAWTPRCSDHVESADRLLSGGCLARGDEDMSPRFRLVGSLLQC